MKPYDILQESVKFANKQLDDFKASTPLDDVTTQVITALYRKIIELSEGVRVNGANGLAGPAELAYRGLIEAYLAFEFILEDENLTEDRAKAYKVGYHKQQIDALKYALSSPSADETYFELAAKYHESELAKDELQEILNTYNTAQENNSRGYIPKWYSLNGGPPTINLLAKHLANANKTNELFQKLYSLSSVGAHMYMALNSLIKLPDNSISIKPVRAAFNGNVDEYNFTLTRALLVSTSKHFTETIHQSYNDRLLNFLQGIVPFLSK